MDLSTWIRKNAEVQQQQQQGMANVTNTDRSTPGAAQNAAVGFGAQGTPGGEGAFQGGQGQVPQPQLLQNIQANVAALQRQWSLVNAQPDGPNKTAAQQYMTNQMRRLRAMHESVMNGQRPDAQGQGQGQGQMQGAMPGQMPGQVPGQMQGQQMPGQQMPGQQMQGQYMQGQQMQGQQMQGQQMQGQQMPGQQMQGQTMPGQQIPGQSIQGQQMPSQQMPSQTMTQQMPAQSMPAPSPIQNQAINMQGQPMSVQQQQQQQLSQMLQQQQYQQYQLQQYQLQQARSGTPSQPGQASSQPMPSMPYAARPFSQGQAQGSPALSQARAATPTQPSGMPTAQTMPGYPGSFPQNAQRAPNQMFPPQVPPANYAQQRFSTPHAEGSANQDAAQASPHWNAAQPPQRAPSAGPAPSTPASPMASAVAAGMAQGRDFPSIVQAFLVQCGAQLPPDWAAPFVGPAAQGQPGETRTVDLQRLFVKVVGAGGADHVHTVPNGWAMIASQLDLAVGPPGGESSPMNATPTPSDVPRRLAAYYVQRLGLFEKSWLAAQRRNEGTENQEQRTPVLQPQSVQTREGSAGASTPTTRPLSAPPSRQPSVPPPPAPVAAPVAAPNPFQNMEPAQVQAAVNQHMTQLQSMVAANHITPQQAMVQYNALQQALQTYNAEKASAGAQTAPAAPPRPFAAQTPWQAPPPAEAPAQPKPEEAKPIPTAPNMEQLRSNPAAQQALQLIQRGGLNPTQYSIALAIVRSALGQGQDAQGRPQAPGAPGVVNVPPAQGAVPGAQAMPTPVAPGMPGMPAGPAPMMAATPSPTTAGIPGSMAAPAVPPAPVVGPPVPGAPARTPTPGASVAASGTPAPAGTPSTPGVSTGTPVPPSPMTGLGASAVPVAPTPTTPAAAAPTPSPAPAKTEPTTYKIEYLPWHTNLVTYGGRDLDRIDRELVPRLAAYAQPRGVHELGTVDIYGLTMSLESRLSFEMAYAVNTLLILSAGVNAPPSFQVPLASCDRLLDVLLDVLVENALGLAPRDADAHLAAAAEAEDAAALRSYGVLSETMPTYCASIDLALQDAGELRTFRRAPTPAAEAEADRRVSLALSILVILRNVSMMPDNVAFLAQHPRFLPALAALGRAAQNDVRWGAEHDTSLAAFSLAEVLQIRKDLLTILLGLAGEHLALDEHAPITMATWLDLLRFFVLDANEFEARYGAPPLALERLTTIAAPQVNVQALMYQVPHHARFALQALSCFALPDANRESIAKYVPGPVLAQLAHALIAMMPVELTDFRRLSSASRLEYTETAATCLFHLVYLVPPTVKVAVRDTPGVPAILFRAAKRLLQSAPDYTRNPYGVLCRRLLDTLKLLSDGEDLFCNAPLQGMYWPAHDAQEAHAGDGQPKMRTGLLLDQDEAVLDILIRTPSVEESVADELLALVSAS